MTPSEHDAALLVTQFASMVERFKREYTHAHQDLQQLSLRLSNSVRQAADEQFKKLPDEVIRHIRNGLEASVKAYEQRLSDAGEKLQQSSDGLASQIHRAEVLQKYLIWKLAGITIGIFTIFLVSSVLVSMHYIDQIRENQVSADLLKAYDEADVTLCGNGRLCVRPDPKAKRYGEYLMAAPR